MARTNSKREERLRREAEEQQAARARTLRLRVFIGLAAAVLALGAVFVLNQPGGPVTNAREGTSAQSGQFPFVVGNPGPGRTAPPISLPSTRGGTFDLASQRGKTVMLYFQEGLMCQPCWDQIKDLERQMPEVRALGIDEMVSITTDPLDALKQKVTDEGLSTPVLSDPDLNVSRAYEANRYGMMGDSRDGHSFIVVGPEGRIRFRADYGGAPEFTMFVPVASLLADVRRGLSRADG